MNLPNRKKREFPETTVLIILIILFLVIVSYIIPTGEFDRVTNESGQTLVVPGSYKYVDAAPVSPLDIPGAIYRGSMTVADIIIFILIVGGAFELMLDTKVLDAACRTLAWKMRGKELLIIPILAAFFSVLGFTEGFSIEALIFIPLGITITRVMHFDRVTGAAVVLLGGLAGWTAGVVNPFNVGIAQCIAELELFSGMWLRWILLFVLWGTASVYIVLYEKKCRSNPKKSVMYGVQEDVSKILPNEEYEDSGLTVRQQIILWVIILGFAILIYGLVKFGWYFEEMTALLLVMGIICAFINKSTANHIALTFNSGACNMGAAAVLAGFCAAISVIMKESMILDTIINAIATSVSMLPHFLQAIGLFIAQSIMNVLIVSGPGQAVATMPIMAPLADLIGITRQTAVLAFQLGDGFSNCVLPTAVGFVGSCAIAGIPYAKWVKFAFPLFVIWTVIGCVFMLFAVATGYC